MDNYKTNLIEDLFKIKSPLTFTKGAKTSNELDSRLNSEYNKAGELFSQKSNSHIASKSTISLLHSEPSIEESVQKLSLTGNEDILAIIPDKSDEVTRLSLRENMYEKRSHLLNTMDSTITKSLRKGESENTMQYADITEEPKLILTDQPTKLFTKEPIKSRRNIKIVNDPLGLLSNDGFSDQNLKLEMDGRSKNTSMPNTEIQKTLPDWLSGNKTFENNESEKQEDSRNTNNPVSAKQNIEFYTNAIKNVESNQQSELSKQIKHSQQMDQLNIVTTEQSEMCHNQNKQFNTFPKSQFEGQSLIEKQLKMQHEQNNQFINMLMSMLSPIVQNAKFYENSALTLSEKEVESKKQNEEMENTITELQARNTKLENDLSIISKRHESELSLQAEFYERQISFLKEAVIKSEERLKQEIESLEMDYIAKLEKLKEEKVEIETTHKKEIHNIKNEHAKNIEGICQLHFENIQLLQKEYSNVIGNIYEAKKTENQMIQMITNRRDDIESILQKTNGIINIMEEKGKSLEMKHKEVLELHESNLKEQKTDIEAQKLELKHQNDTLEQQRNKFMETTEILQSRLAHLIDELQKQNKLSNQAQEMLEKKAASLMRERDLFEEKMKWDRDYMQILKQSWIKEQEKQLEILAAEKEAVATERAQLEVLRHIKNNNDIEKVEVQAVIKSAQEAIASATKEKLKWQEKINELNVEKEVLQDKENLLILRAKEVGSLMESALTKKVKETKVQRKLNDTKAQSNAKFDQLQVQVQAIMEKGKTLNTECYDVLKGKMVTLAYETEELERVMNTAHHFQEDVQLTSQITTGGINTADPNLFMLKLGLNDEFCSIYKYT